MSSMSAFHSFSEMISKIRKKTAKNLLEDFITGILRTNDAFWNTMDRKVTLSNHTTAYFWKWEFYSRSDGPGKFHGTIENGM